MHKKIAILAGDGVGSEVMRQAVRILDAIAKKFFHQFDYQYAEIGGSAYEKFGDHCPDTTLLTCQQSDAILFGSVGGGVDEQHLPKWKNCEANSILKIRQYFDLAINIRPTKIYQQLLDICPLKSRIVDEGVDFVIFRELTGGIYFGRHEMYDESIKSAIDESVYDEKQIRHIAHSAFKAASERKSKVCSVDKANVLATSKLWRAIVSEVGEEYPSIELTHMLVDNCAMQMITRPQQFDVILTENMFGDILSDLAAVFPGSLGLVPSASLSCNGLGLYEPSGGSAPDIAGKNIANPIAQILSAAMLLRYSFSMNEEASAIEQAVVCAISQGKCTADICLDEINSPLGTEEMTDAILDLI